MDKALKMGRDSTAGSFHLFIGKLVSTAILAIEAVILGVFIRDADYGLYVVALIPVATFSLFQDWGVDPAITRYCAQCGFENREANLRSTIIAGLTFKVAMGVILSIASLATANFVATTIFGRPESAFLISTATVTIFSTAILGTAQSVFIGFEQISLYNVTVICPAIVQSVVAASLVILGYGAAGALTGYALSIVVASILSIVLLYSSVLRNLPHEVNKASMLQTLKSLLHYGVPLAMATILAGILTQFYSFIMASCVDNAMIGNYRTATNFALVLAFFTFPISTVLFPAFSKVDPKRELSLLKTVFALSVKYTALLFVPVTLAVMVLSGPMMGALFGDKWSYSPFLLSLIGGVNLIVLLGDLSINSFFSAMGETRLQMKLYLLTFLIGVPLGFLLVPKLGITGVIIGPFVAGIPKLFIGLYLSWKRYDVKIDFQASAKIFTASAIAAGIALLALSVMNTTSWLKLFIGGTLFLLVYLISAPLTGAVNQTDVDNLRAMFSGLGFISKLLEVPLKILEKMPVHSFVRHNKDKSLKLQT